MKDEEKLTRERHVRRALLVLRNGPKKCGSYKQLTGLNPVMTEEKKVGDVGSSYNILTLTCR